MVSSGLKTPFFKVEGDINGVIETCIKHKGGSGRDKVIETGVERGGEGEE
jgi:hypothetical protein